VKRFLVALACCGALFLSACSRDSSSSADPGTPSPTASSSSAEPSPTETGPTESPEEFIRRWLDLSTEMQNTGETAAFEATCPRSGSCRRLIRAVRSYYDAGGYIKTGKRQIIRAKVVGGSHVKLQLNVTIRSTPTEYKTSANSPVQKLTGGVSHNQFQMRWAQSQWVIQEWTQTV
jgi:hypothetical protein